MKRLTDGNGFIKCFGCITKNKAGGCMDCDVMREICNALAAYEDSGLEPSEIAAIKTELAIIKRALRR